MMKSTSETKQEVTQRKIRNGKRKQAEKIWNEKMKVWDAVKYGKPDKPRTADFMFNVSKSRKGDFGIMEISKSTWERYIDKDWVLQ